MLSCIKYIVIIYNFIFWLLGVSVLGFSVFLYMESKQYLQANDASSLYITPFLVLIVLGAIMTLVGFLGCCGAVRESTCMLATYFLLCVMMGVACGASVWWTTQHEDQVKEQVLSDFKIIIRERYGTGDKAADFFVDNIQVGLQCCGVQEPKDWAVSKYNLGNKTGNIDIGVAGGHIAGQLGLYKVPVSCCEPRHPECSTTISKLTLATLTDAMIGMNKNGCYDKIKVYVQEQWSYMILVAAVVIGVQAFAILFACCLCCAISRAENK